jgi:hypothetical protein
MTPTEAVLLCRYVKAACPQQHIDEYTPDAWGDLLGDLRFADAKEAARNLGQRQHFIDPADIRAEVRRIRNRRIDQHPPVEPPPDLDPQQQLAWTRAIARRIGDGEQIPDQYRGELTARDIHQLTGGTAA